MVVFHFAPNSVIMENASNLVDVSVMKHMVVTIAIKLVVIAISESTVNINVPVKMELSVIRLTVLVFAPLDGLVHIAMKYALKDITVTIVLKNAYVIMEAVILRMDCVLVLPDILVPCVISYVHQENMANNVCKFANA